MANLGRPRSFNREEALLQAMRVFWAQGYDGATLTELQAAMGGIAAPSFYAAFGSKEKLFYEAVELYSQTLGAPMIEVLGREPAARVAIERLLDAAVAAFCKPGAPRGCMLISGALNLGPANRQVQEYLRGLRVRRRNAIRERLRRGIAEGELPQGLNAGTVATFYTTVVDGLAIQARDGLPRKALLATAHCAMAAWDSVIAESSSVRRA
ncbi:MAG: TetR/AcrR family transcriptional regulator [Ignavibacteriota bacterium]